MFRNLCLVLHGSIVILLSRYVVFKIIFYSISLSYVNNEQIYPTIRFCIDRSSIRFEGAKTLNLASKIYFLRYLEN